MLQICPKCHSAYNLSDNDKCPRCSKLDEIYKELGLVKLVEENNWINGSFEDFKYCTEGYCHHYKVVDKNHCEDSRFSTYDIKEILTSSFKLSLDSRQNPIILIEQTPPFTREGRKIIVRKPYICVIFKEDSDESFISLDTFRSHVMDARSVSTDENKRKLLPSLFSLECSYEIIYNRLKEQKFKFFTLVRNPRPVINGFEFRSCAYITEMISEE